MNLLCAHCNKPHGQVSGAVNRAAKIGAVSIVRSYCVRRLFNRIKGARA